MPDGLLAVHTIENADRFPKLKGRTPKHAAPAGEFYSWQLATK